MFLSGTLLNATTVLVGGLIGTRLGAKLPERLRANVVRGLGMFTIVLGIQSAIQTQNVIILLFAILLGGLAGSALSLDARLKAIGDALQRRFACVGPLTFLGAIQNGISGDARLLTIKSVLDGFAALAFAASLGWGVLLSVITILVYQGALAAGASLFAHALTDPMIQEMSSAGGVLVMGVGLRLLEIKDVQVADFLPAIVIAPAIVAVLVALGLPLTP
ncbi:MAG: hypothetical protein AUH85_15270 [Chloroflexi bacterium 13_1_40CM_4_68_4]|nr:MAG: hypothetical protein AUH85_15270 [Chloroflexi bacterium 13_1_40CM_4_68_4]